MNLYQSSGVIDGILKVADLTQRQCANCQRMVPASEIVQARQGDLLTYNGCAHCLEELQRHNAAAYGHMLALLRLVTQPCSTSDIDRVCGAARRWLQGD